MTNDQQMIDVAHAWVALWNGDLSLTSRIIDPGFASHAAPLTGGAAANTSGPESLDAWVRRIHQILADLVFAVDLGPFVDDKIVILRWEANGAFQGGYPGATAPKGAPVRFFGTDTLRIDDTGRIVEYWANADSLWFVQQLGLLDVPQLSG